MIRWIFILLFAVISVRCYAQSNIDTISQGSTLEQAIVGFNEQVRKLDLNSRQKYSSGNVLLQSADTSRSVTSSSYAKSKEIVIARDGSLTVKFSMTDDASDGQAIYGRIYRNGEPIGIERSLDANTTTEYTENIDGWSMGDYCQVYLKRDSGLAGASVSNFRIYASKPTTELVTTDTAI